MFSSKTLLFTFLFCSAFALFGQEPNFVELKILGRVMEDEKVVENQAIIVFENNTRIDTLLTKKNGRFEYVVKLNSYYTLVFPKEDMSFKSLVVDTKIPEDFYYIPTYKCVIRLNQEFEDELAEKERYEDFPLGIVKYDNENLRFELDYQYFRSRIKEVK